LDLLIAAHALSLDATLVTNNQTHFARISGLQVANWLKHIWGLAAKFPRGSNRPLSEFRR
jgi:hypothetical protein